MHQGMLGKASTNGNKIIAPVSPDDYAKMREGLLRNAPVSGFIDIRPEFEVVSKEVPRHKMYRILDR
jgi:hypothetical protein